MADIVDKQEAEVEVWIRPERVGYGYTVEWTTVEFDRDEQEWRSSSGENDSTGVWRTLRDMMCQLLSPLVDKKTGEMPTFDVDPEAINVFVVDDRYLFKHYFDEDELFAALRPYYNADEYRFEVPEEAFEEVQQLLRDRFYEPEVVEALERFCVVKRKYTDHPDVLFKASVLKREHQDYNVFLMKDQLSVEQAVNNGATRLSDSGVGVPF